MLTPELLLKDDDLVRVDYEQERNLVRAHEGSVRYLDVSTEDSAHLKQPDEEGGFRPQDADELPANQSAGHEPEAVLADGTGAGKSGPGVVSRNGDGGGSG